MNGQSYPSATELASALRERKRARGEETNKVTMTQTKLEPQQLAWLELLLRAGADEAALAEYRQSLGVHHKSFAATVRELRKQIAASKRPSPMAAQLQEMLDAAEEAQDGAPAVEETPPPVEVEEPEPLDEDEPDSGFEMQPRPLPLIREVTVVNRVIEPSAVVQPKGAAGLAEVLEWLGRIRTMRDELAELGVKVEGSLSISIDL